MVVHWNLLYEFGAHCDAKLLFRVEE